MTVEEEMTLSKEAHLQKIEKDPANIARIGTTREVTTCNYSK